MPWTEQLTLDELAAYQRELSAERSPFTVRKERAALNSFLRFLLEHELVDPPQAGLALAVQAPRPRDADARRPIAALSERQYERLVGDGERLAEREPLRDWRDRQNPRLRGSPSAFRCTAEAAMGYARPMEDRPGSAASRRTPQLQHRGYPYG